MSDEDIAAQEEEIQTLQSIYLPGELLVSKEESGLYKLEAVIEVSVPENYKVRYALNERDEPIYLNVKYLTPVRLKIFFPKHYPSTKCPTSRVYCSWLSNSRQKKLRSSLRDLWDQNLGFPIVYTWIEHVKNETLYTFEIQEELDLMHILAEDKNKESGTKHVRRPGTSSSRRRRWPERERVRSQPLTFTHLMRIIHNIEVHNMEKEQLAFINSFYYCEICCSDKLGKDSIRFEPCKHVFCNECLKSYFTGLINEGSSCAVKCPGFRCSSEAAQYQVRQLLPPELFEKYDSALLSTMLDSMSDIVYCPRPKCQYPVTWDREERMAVCPQCHYAFCIHCRMGYHGIEPCKYSPEQREKLIESYQNGTQEEKEAMESRYGKKHLTQLIENFLSEGWKDTNGKRCPKCNIVIEKNHGCNKMTCFRCQTPFCWLCSKILDPAYPYYHFQDTKSPCQGQLFFFDEDQDLLDEDENWWDMVEDSGSEDIQGEDSDTDNELDV